MIKNLILDTPSEICDCALFATTRTNLLSSISNILIHNNLENLSHDELTQLDLYDHCNLGKTLNYLVLQASIKYIHARTTRIHGQVTRIYDKNYWGLNYII